ncbi:MAG: molybdopterin-guanine dinucleotide biosynthesis protein B [Firmicutes bacterium]|nr:molybdopterin-guanine dinucleotide biosynthesis protein B [Bacillota bacterium]
MKIFSVIGITKSGKTTTIENIIQELRKRRYTVGSIKEIHFEAFAMDTPGSNTDRHRQAGSQLVTARGNKETDILFDRRLTVDEIMRFYDFDYVVMEGVTDTCAPKIITAHNTAEVDERLDETVFAISGKLANTMQEYKGLPVINAITDRQRLVDLIEEKVFSCLPDMPPECCSACGFSCKELAARILRGEAKREDCVISDGRISLEIDGQEITMVPFVQKILYNAVAGVVKELDGYRENGEIIIKIKGK